MLFEILFKKIVRPLHALVMTPVPLEAIPKGSISGNIYHISMGSFQTQEAFRGLPGQLVPNHENKLGVSFPTCMQNELMLVA